MYDSRSGRRRARSLIPFAQQPLTRFLLQTPSLHRVCGIDPTLSMILARIASCVARRKQYQAVYGTLDFLKPSVDTGTYIPFSASIHEHETATKALITCVRDVTESLTRWKADYDSHSASFAHTVVEVRSMIYWHACRILLFRHVYRRPADDTECQHDAAAILQLCGNMVNGKIEYLNWVSVRLFARKPYEYRLIDRSSLAYNYRKQHSVDFSSGITLGGDRSIPQFLLSTVL